MIHVECCGESFQPGSMSDIPYRGRIFVALSRSQEIDSLKSPLTKITTQPYYSVLHYKKLLTRPDVYLPQPCSISRKKQSCKPRLLTSHFGLCDNPPGPFDGIHTQKHTLLSRFEELRCPIDRLLIGCHVLHKTLFIESAWIFPDPARS